MGVIKWNNADANVNLATGATAVTAANSGSGRAGHAFDVVQEHAQFTYHAPSLSPQGNGSYYVNTCLAYTQWSITNLEFWGSLYARLYPEAGGSSATIVFVEALGAADAGAASLTYNPSTGKITVGGQSGSGSATTTGAVTNNAIWARIDWHFKMHATAGVAQTRVWFDIAGAPNTSELITETSQTTLGTMAKLRIGSTTTPGIVFSVIYDDVIIDDRNWVDRRPHPVSRMGRVLSA